MAVETDTIRSIFLNTDDFGQSATYTVQGGSATTISGILDKESDDIESGGEVGVVYSITTFMSGI